MRRWIPALIFAALLGLLARGKGGNLAGIFVGCVALVLYLAIARLAYLRLARQRPEPPTLRAGETALLYGPATWAAKDFKGEGWAYLSDQALTLAVLDEAAWSLPLVEVQEIRPGKRLWRLGGELGIVSQRSGLLRLKVPDAKRWQLALRQAVQTKG